AFQAPQRVAGDVDVALAAHGDRLDDVGAAGTELARPDVVAVRAVPADEAVGDAEVHALEVPERVAGDEHVAARDEGDGQPFVGAGGPELPGPEVAAVGSVDTDVRVAGAG